MSFTRRKPGSTKLVHNTEFDALRAEAAHYGGRKSSVTANLRNRGVQDILIACCDGLNGFDDATPGQGTSRSRRSGYYE
jgi:hypothetical protein